MFGPLLDRLTAVVGIRRVHTYEAVYVERIGTDLTKGEVARAKAIAQTLAALEKDTK